MGKEKGGKGKGGDWGEKSAQTRLEEKLIKAAGEAIVEAMQGMSEQELRDRLVSLAQHEKETDDKLEADEAIKTMKEELKNAQGPYKDTLKSIKLQRSYAALRLEEMGKA
jgi:uncharacterized protein YcaQ